MQAYLVADSMSSSRATIFPSTRWSIRLGFFMLLQVATVYAGALYGVNPLGQPGVELSKRLTYGLMGREGYERPKIPGAGAGNGDRVWRV